MQEFETDKKHIAKYVEVGVDLIFAQARLMELNDTPKKDIKRLTKNAKRALEAIKTVSELMEAADGSLETESE